MLLLRIPALVCSRCFKAEFLPLFYLSSALALLLSNDLDLVFGTDRSLEFLLREFERDLRDFAVLAHLESLRQSLCEINLLEDLLLLLRCLWLAELFFDLADFDFSLDLQLF